MYLEANVSNKEINLMKFIVSNALNMNVPNDWVKYCENSFR